MTTVAPKKTRSAWPTRELVIDFFRRDVPPGQAVTIATIRESTALRHSTAHCATVELIEIGILALAGRDKRQRGGPWTIKRGERFDAAAAVRDEDEERRGEQPSADSLVSKAIATRSPLELAWSRSTSEEARPSA